ncbi:MAG: phosphoadenosine phosphosulfate reductase family protein [Methanosarcina sp.]
MQQKKDKFQTSKQQEKGNNKDRILSQDKKDSQKLDKLVPNDPDQIKSKNNSRDNSRNSSKTGNKINSKISPDNSESSFKTNLKSNHKSNHKANLKISQENRAKSSQGKADNKTQGFRGKKISRNKKASFDNSVDPEKNGKLTSFAKKNTRRFEYEDDYIFWCKKCNLPLIGEECGRCGAKGELIHLSQPADIRFCSPYEREVLDRQLQLEFGCNPLGDRLILLNKIPGEDKTDEVVVDGFIFGILRFELSGMDYKFEPSLLGAKILLKYGRRKKVELKKSNRHLNGKNIPAGLVEGFDSGIKPGDFVLVTAGSLTGYGISYIEGTTFCDLQASKTQAAGKVHKEEETCPGLESAGPDMKALRIRKIDSDDVSLHSEIPDLKACIEANKKHLQVLGKNAINTIRGIVSRNEYKNLPVFVSFSGGKDSLVALELARASLKNRELNAFFLNTGIEFPETVEFVRDFCHEYNIPLEEVDAGSAFWEQVEKFGPPAKDFRWCCKVCKLASAGELETPGKDSKVEERDPKSLKIEKKEHIHLNKEINNSNVTYLTIDGKRRHESFSRAKIAASETNPFVPSQLNIFPIRDWKALEVWLYIYWRNLPYNPLYDLGFERVGCWLCPSALTAEYMRVKDLHPEMYEKWNTFLLEWAKARGLSEEFIIHGFWRWKELPPKMFKLAEELGVSILARENAGNFEIELVGGISPCRAGGFSIEAGVSGIKEKEVANFINVLGNAVYAEELGVLLVKTGKGTIKLFSNGNLLISSETKEKAIELFKETAKQLIRLSRCTGCGICVKACPVKAASLNGKKPEVNLACNRCGKCTEACVVTKYFNKLVPDLDARLKI